MEDKTPIKALVEGVRYDNEKLGLALEAIKSVERYRIDKEIERVDNFDKYEDKKFRRNVFMEFFQKLDPKIYLWTLIFIVTLFNSGNFWNYLVLKLNKQ